MEELREGHGEEEEDYFVPNYHLSSQYKREKFSQKINGIILSTRFYLRSYFFCN
jgi:hypothetical protein